MEPAPSAIKKVESVDDLKVSGGVDCFIRLKGNLRSSKDIEYIPESGTFEIWHMVDGSVEEMSEEELMKSFVGEAITKGALFMRVEERTVRCV